MGCCKSCPCPTGQGARGRAEGPAWLTWERQVRALKRSKKTKQVKVMVVVRGVLVPSAGICKVRHSLGEREGAAVPTGRSGAGWQDEG